MCVVANGGAHCEISSIAILTLICWLNNLLLGASKFVVDVFKIVRMVDFCKKCAMLILTEREFWVTPFTVSPCFKTSVIFVFSREMSTVKTTGIYNMTLEH